METRNNPAIYWTQLVHEAWSIYMAATSKGLCFVGSQNHSFEELAVWAKARFPGSELLQDDARLESYKEEIMQYLQGQRTQFNMPFHIQGTAFQLAVWDALCATSSDRQERHTHRLSGRSGYEGRAAAAGESK